MQLANAWLCTPVTDFAPNVGVLVHNTARHRPPPAELNLPRPGSETAQDQPCPAAALGAITANLLRVFGHRPAGHDHPSIANRHQFSPRYARPC
jgi:hypothetical protein